jgi:hypothetical protein
MRTRALPIILLALLACPPLQRCARAETTDAILDSLQYGAFRYFWDEANPANGLIHDRSQPGSVCSIASTGFGLSAICIGVDHGWVTRAAGRTRVLTTLQTFWNGPQGSGASGFIGFLGLYYHWLDMNTATRTWDSELSTIDTALLFAGMLDAKQFFDTADPGEVQIRALADSIYRRASWFQMRNFSAGIYMGWKPVGGFNGFGKWDRIQRGDDPLPARDRGAGGVEERTRERLVVLDRQLQLEHAVRLHLRELPAAVRPPVLALLDRLPRREGRIHAPGQPQHRLLRELAACDAGAAGLLHRQPLGIRRLQRHPVGHHGERLPERLLRARRARPRRATTARSPPPRWRARCRSRPRSASRRCAASTTRTSRARCGRSTGSATRST